MRRVRRDEGWVDALCTLCERETQQRLVVTGLPRHLGRLREFRRYRYCEECQSRQAIDDASLPR